MEALSPPDQGLYEFLDPNKLEIRLLDLHPSTEKDSPIVCNLRKLPVGYAARPENGVTFEALSYTWGDPSIQDTTIVVNNQLFGVTHNLEAFLRRRREACKVVTLWIDAVCINQQDLEEKNYQIPIMCLIYSAAWRCTIWLGPESNDSAHAMRCLAWLGSSSPYEKMPLLEERTKAAVQSLLSRAWWTRVWIIQELVMGGMGTKLDRLEVLCGEETVPWAYLVVAAARIQAYHDDLRQPFPNIRNILELDSLRESAYKYWLPWSSAPNREYSLGLLCRYRHFLASNPRDKLYAVYNIFCRPASQKLPARYDVPVTNVYLSFALDEINAGQTSLELLRQCGPSTGKLSSWVPDWSVPLGCMPLPARRIQRYFDVPWWAEPTEVEPHKFRDDGTLEGSRVRFNVGPTPGPFARGPEAAEHQKRIRLRRLEIGAMGYGVVEDFAEIPPNFTFHNAPDDAKRMLEVMVANKTLVLSVSDGRLFSDDGVASDSRGRDAVKEGEIITERLMKRWLLDQIKESKSQSPYRAAGDTRRDISIDEKRGLLSAKGLLVDTVDLCHEPFSNDVDSDWKDATRFMVAVGHCKKIALSHGSVAARYPQLAEKMEVFWKTLFVGQVVRPDNFETSEEGGEEGKKLQYADWLPEIPSGWSATEPPTTATTTGLAELAEMIRATKLAEARLSDANRGVISGTERSSLPHEEYSPEDWTDDARLQHKSDMKELASLWEQQPFDLYHRPFSFLHVVPDPYWDTRKTQDNMALQSTKDWRPRVLMSLPAGSEKREEGDSSIEAFRELAERHHEIMTETPSMIPQATLEPGLEKYALGRRFFITKTGYMGLGPKDMKAGDEVAVLFGSDVLFLLRQGTAGANQEAWRLMGECYIQGLMSGEAVEDCKSAESEARVITIA